MDHFRLEQDAGLFENLGLHRLDKPQNIVRCGAAEIDDEARVLLGDRGAADTQAFESGSLDKCTGESALGALENTAGIRMLERLFFLAGAQVLVRAGFDNSVYSSISVPNITTIEVNTAQMANVAVEALLEKIDSPSFSIGMIQVKGKIIFKDSVMSLNY